MRLRATVAYDGTDYLGWQSQRGRTRTLQETIEHALSVVLRQPVTVRAAGRTDTGVHARGQVIAFDVADGPLATAGAAAADPRGRAPLDIVLRSTNAVLPDDVVLRDLRPTRADFDPRRDAIARAYRYRIWNDPVRSPFEQRTAWHVRIPLDDRAMAEAASHVVGERDFASLQGADHEPRTSVRKVERCTVERSGPLVEVFVVANAFLRHMVRNLVGELVEIGLGRRAADGMPALLAARDRRLAAAPAPPGGLSLEWVCYPEDR